MPMPKPTKVGDLNIGANGGTNQTGRIPKTLDVKIVKPHKLTADEGGIPDLHLRMVALAKLAATQD